MLKSWMKTLCFLLEALSIIGGGYDKTVRCSWVSCLAEGIAAYAGTAEKTTAIMPAC